MLPITVNWMTLAAYLTVASVPCAAVLDARPGSSPAASVAQAHFPAEHHDHRGEPSHGSHTTAREAPQTGEQLTAPCPCGCGDRTGASVAAKRLGPALPSQAILPDATEIVRAEGLRDLRLPSIPTSLRDPVPIQL